MPKIEVNKAHFFDSLKKEYSAQEFEELLPYAKAELDSSVEEYSKDAKIKIELNDTNRPDLWSSAGLLRLLMRMQGIKTKSRAEYLSFFSTLKNEKKSSEYVIRVSSKVKNLRPYIAGFLVNGKKISGTELEELIQTQEKLCTNYGKKRQSLAMGVYRANLINWPISYTTEEKDFTFAPLGFEKDMTIKEILEKHPKGMEYGYILEGSPSYPILKDAKDNVLSFPPIINSNNIGAVEAGDDFLFVEFTGTQKTNVLLACNMISCDFFDAGWNVLPVKIESEESFATPLYFQKPVRVKLSAINALLQSSFLLKDVIVALDKMGSDARIINEDELEVLIAPYRNDYLHPVDVAEDVMIATGLTFFEAERPKDFTIGRLLPATLTARKMRHLLVGMGYEEVIFNYLGSKEDYIEKMGIDGRNVLEIVNPISESYQMVRPSILPSLLFCESSSAHATYPHKIFELGKVAYIDKTGENGCKTANSLGFLTSEKEANYNKIASELSSLFYYLNLEYQVKEEIDSRFILGRCASINLKDVKVGIFGEVSPEVLAKWQIFMPCVACILDVDSLIRI